MEMKWEVSISSAFDREELIANIFCDNEGIIEISQEEGYYEIYFSNNKNQNYPLDKVLEMIGKATARLDELKTDK